MNTEWKNCLENDGAEFSIDGFVESFGNSERERRVTTSGNILCDLSHYGLIAVYGKDASSFLQNQFSNNVQDVSDQCSQISSYSNPKGRVISSFLVFKRDDTYYLKLPYNMVESVLKRLRMYVLRSDVTLEDANASLVRFGLSGPSASEKLQDILGAAVPQRVNQTLNIRNITVIRVMGIHPRFELYGSSDDMKELWSKLNVHSAPVGLACWGLLNVLAGIADIYPETSEAFVAQMINMDLVGGISFKKGCYPGQEIVARMHYLGNLKRRMYLVRMEDTDHAARGESIVQISDEKNESSTGTLLEAYRHPDGGMTGLAVMQISSVEKKGIFHLGQPHGPKITIGLPPYPLQVDEAV